MTGTGTSVLALITTLHFAVMVLLRHRIDLRGIRITTLLPSLFFAASPWFLSTPIWLASVFALHVVWYVACDKLLEPPEKPARPAKPSGAAPPHESAPKPRPATFQNLPVLAVFSETPEIRTFRFARPAGFSFKPGQFVMVKAEIDGEPVVRCYSISSSPSSAGYLEISVRNQGKFSGFLHATIRPGSTLQVKGPGGTFTYPEGSRPLVLLAAGIGITPLLSMLRYSVEHEPMRPVTLVYSARTVEHIAFLDDLRLLGRRHPNFRLAIALSRGADDPGFFSGRIDRDLLETVVEHARESVYMLCGPQPMIEQMQTILESLEVPRAQVHFEKFEAAVASAVVAAADPGQAASTSSNGICVRLERRGRVVSVRRGQSILDAAESAGEEIPSMCRAGVCGTCQVRLIEGRVDGEFDVIDEPDRVAGEILACVARPLTDCVIDA